MDKRLLLRSACGASLGLLLGPKLFAQYGSMATAAVAEDEAFWAAIRGQFRVTSDYVNLENGYYCFQPEGVLDAFVDNVRAVNLEASHYMRTRQYEDKRHVREKLAAFAGCSPEELVITRNTTESLDTVISGFDWRAGDEAVLANQDYGSMIDMFKLQARRYGMVNRFVDIPMDPRSDDDIVKVYADALTRRTRLLMVPHMVNITGQILPVRAICDMAHGRGVQVMIDAAHTFAHIDYRIPDLHCDYYGASLHKWLSAPLGAGVLYVKRERIEKLWPIYADDSVPADDIRKLNHTGTHPVHTDLTIERALKFHEMIGSARKEARLRYLQRYWTRQARGMKNIVMNTPEDPKRSCAIANVGVQGLAPNDLARILLEKYKVYTVAINGAGVRGVRVTPQVYTSTAELDTFVRALKELSG
ncbi:MAG TPA: aminotransferase class V-fold PLP-dependent enzyme [Steroidobacteraceae bacterium]|nr:aminotransferase class V-fold PLP-dependent enzyme [Steroidobacteraceae bacterium]